MPIFECIRFLPSNKRPLTRPHFNATHNASPVDDQYLVRMDDGLFRLAILVGGEYRTFACPDVLAFWHDNRRYASDLGNL